MKKSVSTGATDEMCRRLEGALREKKLCLHGFLSGGGLRVLRAEDAGGGRGRGDLRAYGEGPNFEAAMSAVGDDYGAIGSEERGKDRFLYLTGSSTPDSELDKHLLGGNSFDAWVDPDGLFAVSLDGFGETTTPEDVLAAVRAMAAGRKVRWESRGHTYESSMCSHANGGGISTSLVESPAGSDPWMYREARRGRGTSLAEAFKNALRAEPVEVARK